MYQLIFGSELERAKEFRRWVFKEVLPSIRKTGTYTARNHRSLDGEQMCLLSENDLHFKVVEYIRKYHPNTLIIAGLGEFQRTLVLRIEGWKKGYTAVQPDIIITDTSNGYTGFAIEFKTPRGTGGVSPKQFSVLYRLEERGYRTLISNDYTEIVVEIHKYFQEDTSKVYKNEIRNLKPDCPLLTANSTPTVFFTAQFSMVVNTNLQFVWLIDRTFF